MKNWQLLSKEESEKVWDIIHDKFKFNPSINKRAKSFKIEQNHVIYDISHIWKKSSFDSLCKDLEDKMLEVFKFITHNYEEIYALNWQHESYKFNPRGEMPRDEFGEWLVPILPDGDYYFFIEKDFEWGYIGHPWQKTITIFGDELIEGIKLNKPCMLDRIGKEVTNTLKI
ncbi:DUF2716 domain-containing protein [Haloplasma contractile]|nr:DUF2716 domain-containing protein [Haloplasma contractile]